MKIHKLKITNFRCFEDTEIELGNIAVFTGQNNSGKSSILRAILLLQAGTPPTPADVRAGKNKAIIDLNCSDITNLGGQSDETSTNGNFTLEINTDARRESIGFSIHHVISTQSVNVQPFANTEPLNALIPYLSKRKVAAYSEEVRAQHAKMVSDMTYLAAKLARITNVGYSGYEIYKKSCEQILGFMLTAVPSANGQRPGMYLPDNTTLTLSEMGEGVPNIAALLIELATAKNKIFVIEEPENDLHPTSLKALLELILISSQHNQFLISTHSNIVTQYLGSQEGSLYYVRKSEIRPPTSNICKIDNSPSARLEILRELGYSLSDFELWEGWLILEESSAERIIRDYLIPNFAPGLSAIRTLAANGVNEVETTFNDFHRLVRFTHLETVYRNTTWVKVDGDDAGGKIVERLKNSYPGWDAEKFTQFSQPQFEKYYPRFFSKKIDETLSIIDKKTRRESKKILLNEVLAWLKDDKARGIEALAESAKEVIDFLIEIEKMIFKQSR